MVRLVGWGQDGGWVCLRLRLVGDVVGDLGFHVADAGVGVGYQAFNP